MSNRAKTKAGTEIRFRYKKPKGFRIGDPENKEYFGNFTPTLTTVLLDPKEHPAIAGNVWVDGYDFNEEHVVHLPSEIVPDLPDYIAKHNDASVASAYQLKRAEEAAKQHEKNNRIRDELQYFVDDGTIEVTYDSFMEASKTPVKVTAPEKTKEVKSEK